MDGTRIGDKPGLETCVVSQVVADSLARLPLEGRRDTRHVLGRLHAKADVGVDHDLTNCTSL